MFQQIDLPMKPATSTRGSKIGDKEISIGDCAHQPIVHPAKHIIARGRACGASIVKSTAAPTPPPNNLPREGAMGTVFVQEGTTLGMLETQTNDTV